MSLLDARDRDKVMHLPGKYEVFRDASRDAIRVACYALAGVAVGAYVGMEFSSSMSRALTDGVTEVDLENAENVFNRVALYAIPTTAATGGLAGLFAGLKRTPSAT